jgi:sugar/nucleoside kinase (ribokinase family)
LKDLLKYVDVLLPNEREATRITGTDDPEIAIRQLAEMVPLVVVKLGHQGALAQRGKERFTSPSLNVTAVDAVGAGDSFDAGFLHQYLQDSDLPTCLASGNRAGALSVTRPGGTEAFRDKNYRESFLREH